MEQEGVLDDPGTGLVEVREGASDLRDWVEHRTSGFR